MSKLHITPVGIKGGIWSGWMTGIQSEIPQISVYHAGKPIGDVRVANKSADGWLLEVPIDPELICDGVQTFVVVESGTQTDLANFSVTAGEVMDNDIRTELSVLRAELDLLKRAFRRHCVETS